MLLVMMRKNLIIYLWKFKKILIAELMNIQQLMVKDSQPIILTNDTIQDILAESGVSEEDSSKIERFYTKEFGTTFAYCR